MLAENLVEEFEMKEDESWYDQQDLQQGEAMRGGWPAWPGRLRETNDRLRLLATRGRQVLGRAGLTKREGWLHLPVPPREALRSPGRLRGRYRYH